MEAVGQEQYFIAPQVFPVFPSATEVGRYPKFKIGSGELLKAAGGSKRNDSGSYNEVTRKFEWDNYQTEEYGMKERIDDKVATRMANFFDAEMVTSKLLMNELMLDYEIQAAAVANTPGNFATALSTTDSGGLAWSNANVLTMDVPKDVNRMVEAMTLLGEVPEVMILSLTVWNLIRRSQKLGSYIYGFLNVTQGGSQITPQMFAACFGLKDILISKKSYDTTPKGAKTATLAPVWGNAYVQFARLGEGDFMNGGMGRSIIWDADAPGGLWTSESYRDEDRRSNLIRIRSNRVIKIINPNACGTLATNFA